MTHRGFSGAAPAGGGCAACGVVPSAADADRPTTIEGSGYALWFVGAQRDTIINGKLAAALDLNTLAGKAHLYGLGPLAELRGEVTIADSRPALARVMPDGSLQVTESFAAGAPFFVWASVARWRQVAIPPAVSSFEDLERFVPEAAAASGIDVTRPLPFLVHGRDDLIEFHVLNRIGSPPHNREEHKKIQVTFELENAEAIIVGFYSTGHRGIFTPADSDIHIHFQTPDNRESGHIQKLRLGRNAVLSLPQAAG